MMTHRKSDLGDSIQYVTQLYSSGTVLHTSDTFLSSTPHGSEQRSSLGAAGFIKLTPANQLSITGEML
jgi:hypothetical protein